MSLLPLLRLLPAEYSHDFTLSLLARTQGSLLEKIYAQSVPSKPVKLWDLSFANPLGLAAGLDKNGRCVDAFLAMGFGFVEIGTVTPVAQPGNDKPRLFRLPEKQCIINRMGFNNHGVDHLLANLKQAKRQGIVGINIGKNKQTAEENALSDYQICLEKVYHAADYVTVNISSPNTPGLRNLQFGQALDSLLQGLKVSQTRLAQVHGRYCPILVKIAPDMDMQELDSVAGAIEASGLDGIIATNTTLARDSVAGLRHANEAGGLSGPILQQRSLAITTALANKFQGKLPIISVGGIDSAVAARDRLNAGANLVQVYTSFIYQGPRLINDIVSGI